ncbi:hypothetical protein FN846DRAFT_978420 [Sphaerosporella brunnea]|uniref:SH3 domain-containing protein n=1 Tax=Sphaerosporella brunnea TaxID=1250544 RepID=A0A5J5ED92_9PEZI|nr:hypothetical protein FN846DRAFT_978420 [Sphaerosporella brunnea]
MHINNPIPSNLQSECRKAARILTSFVDPKQSFGPDKIIPPSILANAKGLAILSVAKAGFLVTVRGGSGLVIARRPDGSWSAPSAIGTAGAGFGGQLGAELTDFVFILNDASAVKTFAQAGSLTLGGNVSVAAGPVGRNAEAGGAASIRSVAAIFSYSKTKGLFAGVSLEGSVIMERKDANAKFYGGPISARQLLSGTVHPPPEADVLMRVLGSRVFSGRFTGNSYDDMYNDIPQYDDRRDDFTFSSNSRRASGFSEDSPRGSFGASQTATRNRASTWNDDPAYWDRHRADPATTFDAIDHARSSQFQRQYFNSTYSDNPVSPSSPKKGPPPGRPTAPKPVFKPQPAELRANQAVALYTFNATEEGDLGFKKGDIITITKRTESKNDWWTGQLGDKTGIFPSNYVEAI